MSLSFYKCFWSYCHDVSHSALNQWKLLFIRFEKLCDMLSCNSALGITAGALMELYQMEFQTEIEAHHAKVLRDIDLSGQFRIADKDGDGRLNAVSSLSQFPFVCTLCRVDRSVASADCAFGL